MASLGWFDGELRPDAWFDAELQPVAWFDTELLNTGFSLTERRAIYWNGEAIAEIPDVLLGTGKKAIVILVDGTLRERATSEGVPLIMDAGKLRCIDASTETLIQ